MMNVYEVKDISQYISGNPYVGRGIIVGRSADAGHCPSHLRVS